MEESIKNKIEDILKTEAIQHILNASGFYFEKAKEAYDKYIDYKKEDTDFFVALSYYDYAEIQQLAKEKEDIKEFIVKIETLVAYCDSHAKDKDFYNQYEDKRVIARAGIYQNAWTAQLIKYKIDKSSVTQSIHNVFDFINSPDSYISILSENHKDMISRNLLKKEYKRDTFVTDVKEYFSSLNIQLKNEDNRTHLYTRIIYSLKDIWLDEISGLVARDNGDWKDKFKKELSHGQYGVIWWNPRPVQANKTIPGLEEKLKEEGYFYIYYAVYGQTTHRARVVDFSLSENYHKKSSDWKEKEPVWYYPTAEEYEDGRRSASIIFLVDEFIEIGTPFPINNFQMYGTVSVPNRNNLSPYNKINGTPDIQGTAETLPIEELSSSSFITRTKFSLKDKYTLNGVLGVDDLAEELSDIIHKMSYEQGRMIGIFGEWGRGKTFFMDRLWKFLSRGNDNNNKSKIQKVDFHAWKYQDTPAIWAYLYEQFASAYYNSAKNSISKLCLRLTLNLYRLGGWSILWFFLSFIFTLVIRFFISSETKINWVSGIFAALVATIVNIIVVYFSYRNSARELFKKYYTKLSFTHLLGIQAEVQKELKTLVKVWTKSKASKIILFVDDIDRCSEDKIIQIIDSLRVMLEDEELSQKLIVVTAIDERILKRAVNLKYSILLEAERKKDNQEEVSNTIKILIKEYLDKLFITGIKLGDLAPDEKDEFFLELTKDDRDDYQPKDFSLLNQEENVISINDEEDKIDIEKDVVREENNTVPVDFEENEETGEETTFSYQSSDKESITEDELNMLREKLQLYGKITPRQIRIFYYRYLMAKNLLIKQYETMNRNNIWLSWEYCSLFVELLIRLSEHDDQQIISKLKQKTINIKEDKCKMDLINDTEINTFDYKILIGVLDTVIGY